MDKQKFIQKLTACRVLTDELVADAYDLDDKTDYANGLHYAHEILDAITRAGKLNSLLNVRTPNSKKFAGR